MFGDDLFLPGTGRGDEVITNLLCDTVRDICHAHLAILDHRDERACARTLYGAYKALCATVGKRPDLRPKTSGIGNQGLRETLAGIRGTAQAVQTEFQELLDRPDITEREVIAWLMRTGRHRITALATIVGHLLEESQRPAAQSIWEAAEREVPYRPPM